jgi:hypothetical protein
VVTPPINVLGSEARCIIVSNKEDKFADHGSPFVGRGGLQTLFGDVSI